MNATQPNTPSHSTQPTGPVKQVDPVEAYITEGTTIIDYVSTALTLADEYTIEGNDIAAITALDIASEANRPQRTNDATGGNAQQKTFQTQLGKRHENNDRRSHDTSKGS